VTRPRLDDDPRLLAAQVRHWTWLAERSGSTPKGARIAQQVADAFAARLAQVRRAKRNDVPPPASP
jgi:hypothetical protein